MDHTEDLNIQMMLSDIESTHSKEEYNNIPVHYCKRCLSLSIVSAGDELVYCSNCGCTEVEEIHISNWENKYKEKYGKKLLD